MSEDTMELRLLMPESAQVSQTTIPTETDIARYRPNAGRAGDSEDFAADSNDSDVPRHVSWNRESPRPAFLNHTEHDTDVKHESLHPTQQDGEEGLSQTKLYSASAPSCTYRRIIRLWYLELLACTLSFACFAAIAWVLVYEDGKPLARWDFLMSPTAFVSFFGVLGKSSFLLVLTEVISQFKWLHYKTARHRLQDFEVFDGASRGPLGASRLLWTRRWNSWLASAAALIVLLSLTVSPFIQLVFDFPTRTLPSNLEYASFRRARLYNPGHRAYHNVSLSSEPLDLPMQWAILRSVYDSPMEQSVTCSSGNCTISNAQTLAVCSSCSNMTDEIAVECNDKTPQNFLGRNLSMTCNYIFPPHYNSRPEWVMQGFHLTNTGEENDTSFSAYTRWNSSFTLGSRGANILRLLAVQMPNTSRVHENLRRPAAWACELSLCEQTFESVEVVNGEAAVSRPLEEGLFFANRTFDSLNATQVQVGELFHPLLLANDTKPSYWINSMAYWSMSAYLKDLLVVAWWNNGTFPSGRSTTIYGYDNITPDIGRVLANAEDIPKLFESIAGNMTEEIRLRGVWDSEDKLNFQFGMANSTETYIEVRWAYLAFPFTLTAMSAVLLGVAIILTERSDVPAWRSSSLAVVFHGLQGWNMDGQIATNPGELEDKAKHMRARLSKGEWPPAFVKAD